MNPQATLYYLLGVNEGLAMYSIYSDYAIKLFHLELCGFFYTQLCMFTKNNRKSTLLFKGCL